MEHALGPFHAPVLLEEFGDYECPATRRALPIVYKLLAEFPDLVRFVFRHYPARELHAHAERAAEAAEAAASQGKFWEMHDLLLSSAGRLGLPDLIDFAARLGLDIERFEEEVTNRAHSGSVSRELHEGMRRGVRATPQFFVNGSRYDGALGLEDLRDEIQRALDQEIIRRAI